MRMRAVKAVVLGLSLVAISACVHTNAVMLDPSLYFAPVDPYDVVIYLEASDVPYEYEAIALVHATGHHEWTNQADLIEAMREKAAEYGAHGIIIEWVEEPRAWERIVDAITDEDFADRRGRVLAIRAISDSAAAGSLLDDSAIGDPVTGGSSFTAIATTSLRPT